ncbi:Kiwa anti-phage protein KwaB-like domain-containing protein [Ottowia testudinis]|uniref:DUF4868 domain-containing protein n=1 Tax=Ottowia testudinis TaxID=2816950 RepID=A0A975CJK3_9BURK|nr:Kiwa anti-phage protein KwaB-like domain-containing protein [Ottowia testudinis]QTD46177.1 DUF4868 domain-containing protein [Ottowia testudinis]
MSAFDEWKKFDVASSSAHLWVFKKSTTDSQFRAWYVQTDQEVQALFKKLVIEQIASTTEQIVYGHLAQNNEASCLIHEIPDNANTKKLIAVLEKPEQANMAEKASQLQGAFGYCVKFKLNGEILYAIKKTSVSWKPKTRKSLANLVFKEKILSAEEEEVFSFASKFDFFIYKNSALIASKKSYETSVSEKTVYAQSFSQLSASPGFASLFTSVGPLTAYIGGNAMHLRRMAAVEQKGLFNDPNFLKKLRQVNASRKWGINFASNGKIVPCSNTARLIISVLLDHRLMSEITSITYDVPDATQVA